MSNFNDANELASNLVFGTHYHDNSPREQGKPKSLVFTLTRRVIITADAETHEEWVKVAQEIQDVLDEGFWFKGEGDYEDDRLYKDRQDYDKYERLMRGQPLDNEDLKRFPVEPVEYTPDEVVDFLNEES